MEIEGANCDDIILFHVHYTTTQRIHAHEKVTGAKVSDANRNDDYNVQEKIGTFHVFENARSRKVNERKIRLFI